MVGASKFDFNSWALWAPVLLSVYGVGILVFLFRLAVILIFTQKPTNRPAFSTQIWFHSLVLCSFIMRELWLVYKVPALKDKRPPGWANITNRFSICLYLCAVTVVVFRWIKLVELVRTPVFNIRAAKRGSKGQILGISPSVINAFDWSFERFLRGFIIFLSIVVCTLNLVMVSFYGLKDTGRDGDLLYDLTIITTASFDFVLVASFCAYGIYLAAVLPKSLPTGSGLSRILYKVVFQAVVWTFGMSSHLSMYLYRPITKQFTHNSIFLIFAYLIPEIVPAVTQAIFYARFWDTPTHPGTVESTSTAEIVSEDSIFGGNTYENSGKKTWQEKHVTGTVNVKPPGKTGRGRGVSFGKAKKGDLARMETMSAMPKDIAFQLREPPKLREVLEAKPSSSNGKVRSGFVLFLAKEHSEEKMLFYQACERLFDSISNGTSSASEARNLVDTYIADDAVYEVLLGDGLKDAIFESLRDPIDWSRLKERLTEAQNFVQVQLVDDYRRYNDYQYHLVSAIINL